MQALSDKRITACDWVSPKGGLFNLYIYNSAEAVTEKLAVPPALALNPY
jgi:hypothetical protein